MGSQFNVFSITLLMSGVATLLMSFVIYQRLGGAVKWFASMMLCIAIWSVCYAFELSCTTLDQMLFWIKFEYIGITFLPACWIVFVMKFIGKEEWLTSRNVFVIFLFPVIALLFVWTNDFHHIHYEAVSVDNSGPFPLLAITRGVSYYVHTVYFYFMLLWGIYLLLRHTKKTDIIYTKQNRAIVTAAFIPWVVNLVYFAGIRPFGHIDMTPYAFILTSATIAFGLLRFNLFDLVPLAHEKVIESMKDGVLVLNANGMIIDLNNGMKKFLPAEKEKLVGKTLLQIFPGENRLLDYMDGKEYGKIELEINGRFLAIEISAIVDENTISSGTLMLFMDITERKIVEQKLQQQANEMLALNNLKDKIFSIISHDLRSPLASLISMLGIIREGYISEAEFKSFLPVLSDNVGYTSNLIENLLSWSKSQLKGEAIVPESFDIKTLVKHEMDYFKKSASEKNISIVDNMADGSFVFADKNMIQPVLRNLLSNAVKFCSSGDSIAVSTRTNGGETTICIKDTGLGMSPETASKLFGYKIFTTPGTLKEQGTGIGLMICKDFIEKNGGEIWVESELGKGSTFCFRLKNKKN